MLRERALKALDARLAVPAGWQDARPQKGWLRAIRDALGMTMEQYAERLGVSQPRIVALEKSEVDETASIATLRRAAEALGCRFVYAVVPNQSLEQVLREQAIRTADQQIGRTNHTMRLEAQGVDDADLQKARERLVDDLMRTGSRRLWDSR